MDVAPFCIEYKILLISDGGKKNSGNMCKALAVGADCIMLGRLISWLLRISIQGNLQRRKDFKSLEEWLVLVLMFLIHKKLGRMNHLGHDSHLKEVKDIYHLQEEQQLFYNNLKKESNLV